MTQKLPPIMQLWLVLVFAAVPVVSQMNTGEVTIPVKMHPDVAASSTGLRRLLSTTWEPYYRVLVPETSIGIGTPSQQLLARMSFESGNLWVNGNPNNAPTSYQPSQSSTSQDIQHWPISLGTEFFYCSQCQEYSDEVSVGSYSGSMEFIDVDATLMTSTASEFSHLDFQAFNQPPGVSAIFGLTYEGTNQSTLGQLYAGGAIQHRTASISLCDQTGTVTLGGAVPSWPLNVVLQDTSTSIQLQLSIATVTFGKYTLSGWSDTYGGQLHLRNFIAVPTSLWSAIVQQLGPLLSPSNPTLLFFGGKRTVCNVDFSSLPATPLVFGTQNTPYGSLQHVGVPLGSLFEPSGTNSAGEQCYQFLLVTCPDDQIFLGLPLMQQYDIFLDYTNTPVFTASALPDTSVLFQPSTCPGVTQFDALEPFTDPSPRKHVHSVIIAAAVVCSVAVVAVAAALVVRRRQRNRRCVDELSVPLVSTHVTG
mmetsp:Transcript_21558/g.50732  ORF Transcript_21558/g.50732 Transcript_21558/m.50732 type:complete len:477 (+) Transcript_21558:3-1433(+)